MSAAGRSGVSVLRSGENLLLALALVLMAVMPIAEIVLRATLRIGIPGSGNIVQHLTLAVGMLGGAIAARDGKLLSLAASAEWLPSRFKAPARLFAGAVAGAVTAFLAIASLNFVLADAAGGQTLVGAIPLWAAQALLPLGFGLVALRLLYHASDRWTGRCAAAGIALGIVLLGAHPPIAPRSLVLPAFAILFAATAFGAPIFTTLGGAALILFWKDGDPIASIPVESYRLVVSPTIPTIPLFTLAGYFLAESGASKRLVRLFQALAGWARGGPALVTVLVCAFFTSFTGASGVTILALGGLLLPVLLAARYSERNSLGLITAAGSLGLLFPPSLPVILYGVYSQTPIDSMFLGGLLPGILMLGLTALWGRWQAGKDGAARGRFDAAEAGRALWGAKWELVLPILVLVGLYGGFATLVEVAALTALYAFFVETVIYRDLKIRKDVPRVLTEAGTVVGGVLIILCAALGFTSYLISAEIPARAADWVRSGIHSPYLFLLLLNLCLLVVGCLMDIFSAIIVLVPLIAPMGKAFGIDPIHLGVIVIANLELGFLTPPVGMNLFLSSYRFGKPMSEVCRAVLPLLFVLLASVLLISYFPPLSTALPRYLGR